MSKLTDTVTFRLEDSKSLCLSEIVNNRSTSAIIDGKYSISDRRGEIYLAQAGNFVVGRLSSTVVESIIFQLVDAIQSARETVSTSGLRMQFFVGMYQLPAGGLVLRFDRIPPAGRGIQCPFEKFQLWARELKSA
jgi:hypothetical protein